MDHDRSKAEQLAVGLGLFSIGLGLAELVAPRGLARLIGMPDASETTLRTFGAREIGNGVAILSQPDRAAWLWTRVGGDALDVSYLASGLNSEENDSQRIAGALFAVLGVTALDVICARMLAAGESDGEPRQMRSSSSSRGIKVERVTTINKPIAEVYAFWRNFENLPRFMRHLESVESLGGNRSRWTARAPAGTTVSWEAEILQDRPDEWIAWRSLPGAQVENSGSVRFSAAPGARGTEIRVQLQYVPPAGALGRIIAKLFGEEPNQQVHEDLHRFKQLMETGEIPMSDGPSLWRPAQPVRNVDELRTLVGVSR
jgi:uncharacterized membrane protein